MFQHRTLTKRKFDTRAGVLDGLELLHVNHGAATASHCGSAATVLCKVQE